MSGYGIVMICSWYEGSVRISWYPHMLVLNTTSPHLWPGAPNARPSKHVPSSNSSTAFTMPSPSHGLCLIVVLTLSSQTKRSGVKDLGCELDAPLIRRPDPSPSAQDDKSEPGDSSLLCIHR